VDPERIHYDDVIRIRINGDNSRRHVPYTKSSDVILRFVTPARLRTQHYGHHNTKIKLKAATAIIELLMMGGITPETC
jgi:hypothetical protein